MQFWHGTVAIILLFGAGEVQVRFWHGTVSINLRFGAGAVQVLVMFRYGAGGVQVWCKKAAV